MEMKVGFRIMDYGFPGFAGADASNEGFCW